MVVQGCDDCMNKLAYVDTICPKCKRIDHFTVMPIGVLISPYYWRIRGIRVKICERCENKKGYY